MSASTPPGLLLHLVTLAVEDLKRACAFYEALGLERRQEQLEGVAFFMAGNAVLSLYPRASLAADLGLPVPPGGGSHGITLAYNVRSAEAAAAVMERALAAGARSIRPADAVFWGGVMGYFADPDGHVWEVAFNPAFPFDGEGRLMVPDLDSAR